MKRLTARSWFGPKRMIGWGLKPATWEGWVVSGVMIALLLATFFLAHQPGTRLVIAIVVMVVFTVVVRLTSDPPGPPPTPGGAP